jgi:hypothetical protein
MEEILMRKFSLVILTLLLFGAGSVLAQDIRYNFARDVDFTKFKTYRWVSIRNADQVDELTARQLTAAIDAELARKGLKKTDSDNADLYIGYQTAIGSEKQFTSYQTGWGYGPGWGPGWYGPRWYGGTGMVTTSGSTTTLYVGQLDLDMYQSAMKDLVWRGTATKTLDSKSNPDKQAKNIKKTVEKLLKNYPPKVKK